MIQTNAPTNAQSRDVRKIVEKTGNIYESITIIAKRANQISTQIKDELQGKLEEFASDSDNLEEISENREQIEISNYYEKLPKASLIATEEFIEGKVYFRKIEE